jgi:hypothetical protein
MNGCEEFLENAYSRPYDYSSRPNMILSLRLGSESPWVTQNQT